MVGTRTALASVVELEQQIRIAKQRKKYLEEYLQNLHQSYTKGKISYSFYVETLHLHRDGKTIESWIKYYENCILEYQKLIRKNRRKTIKNNLVLLLFSSVFLFLLFSLSFYIQPELTGFLVQEVEIPEAISEANITLTTIQQQAILGQPVKWIKTVSLSNSSTIKIRLPAEATNISVNKISYSEEALLKEDSSPSQEELSSSETNLFTESNKIPDSSSETKFRITGSVISSTEGERFLSKFFRNFGRITGATIQGPILLQEIEINDTATEYEIEYETPAPYAIEEDIERGKRVKIIGPETIHYENVLVFTTLDESLNIRSPSQVRIHWIENNTFISPTSVQDTDNNGIYDYIEWIAPILSEATFNIIVITKADHLDSNREFISDIYEEVRELDDIWSEEIPDQDYIRVTFEIPLDSSRDITIYPRVLSGEPRIEVYEINGNDLIAEFTNIISNKYNKVFLTNLQGTQDTFDLRVVGGSLEFNHIIDPPQFGRPNNDFATGTWSTTLGTFFDAVDEVSANDDTDYVSSTTDEDELDLNITDLTDPGVNTSFILQFVARSPGGGGQGETAQMHLFEGSTEIATTIAESIDRTAYETVTYTLTDVEAESITDYTNLFLRLHIHKIQGGEIIRVTQMEFQVPEVAADNPPQWFDNSTDGTTAGTNIEHRVRWINGSLSGYIFSFDNGTGIFTNDSFVEMTGTNNWSNVTKPVNITVGATIQWRVYVNDSINQLNATDIFVYNTTAPPDLTNPTSSFGTNPVNNSNESSSTVVFDFKAFDNVDIDFIILYGNWSTGWHANYTNISYINDVWLNITVTSIPDGKYVWGIFSNDTAGNSDFTDTNRTLTIDTTPPTYSNNQTNTTIAGAAVNFSILWNDNIALNPNGQYVFSTNNTGIWVNDSVINFTATPQWANVTKTLNSTVGLPIGYRWYANDSSGNINNTELFILTTTTSANAAPTITNVEVIPAVTPNEAGVNYTTFNFTATDTDGGNTINISTAEAKFQLTGETTRLNTTCINTTGAIGNDLNFTCTIGLWYFDKADTSWTINVTIKDNSDASGENSSTTFQYNSLSAMVISPEALSWPEINPTSTNIGSSNDPIVVNNTGNAESLSINITGFNLQGETTDTQFIFAANFSIQNIAEGCSGTQMSNATSVNVTSTILQRGNNSLNNNNATSGQEELFFCVTAVNSDLTAQSYSSAAYGAWEIKILLAVAVISPRKRKKKKKRIKDNKLIEALDLVEYLNIADKLKEKSLLTDEEIVKTVIDKLSKKYKISRGEFLRIIKAREEITIPITIFSKKLGALESIVKYMKENLCMNYREIEKEIYRDQRTIWTAYKKANEKMKKKIELVKTDIMFPTFIFENKELTILESIIIYLKEKGRKYSEIAELLNRDQRNIWTIYSRAIKKLKKEQKKKKNIEI